MLDTTPLCILRELVEVHAMEEQVFNDMECSLLTLTNALYIIPTSHIISSVSIMYECNSSCTFENAYTSIPREQETLHASKLIYTHDYSNKLFCLIYMPCLLTELVVYIPCIQNHQGGGARSRTKKSLNRYQTLLPA